MLDSRKGQYSVEYTIIMGIGIAIIAAFLIYIAFFYSSFALSSSASQIKTLSDTFANQANYVASQGPGSMQIFPITTPLLQPQYSFFCGDLIKLQTSTELGVSKPGENVSGMLPLASGTFDAFAKAVNGNVILGLKFAISYISQNYTVSGTTISYNLDFYNSSLQPVNSPVNFNVSVFSTNGAYLGSTIGSTSSSSPSTAAGTLVASAYYSEYVIEVTPTDSGDYASECVQSQPPTYVPLTITSSSATPNTFQQEVTVNMADYSFYAASNLENIEFMYPNGTIIPSWRENGTANTQTVTYWLKLGSFTTTNIYMDFFPTNDNVLNTVNDGEAPQLSSTYGEYNNIANVMNSGLLYQFYQLNGGGIQSQESVYQAQLTPNSVFSYGSLTATAGPTLYLSALTGSSQDVNGGTDPNVIINYQYSYSGGSPFPNPPITNPQYVIMKAIGFAVVNSPTTIYGLSDDGMGIGYSNSGGALIPWLGGSSTSNNPNNIINAWVPEGATQYSGTITTDGSYRLEIDYTNQGGPGEDAVWSNNSIDYYSPSQPPNGIMPSVTFGSIS